FPERIVMSDADTRPDENGRLGCHGLSATRDLSAAPTSHELRTTRGTRAERSQPRRIESIFRATHRAEQSQLRRTKPTAPNKAIVGTLSGWCPKMDPSHP